MKWMLSTLFVGLDRDVLKKDTQKLFKDVHICSSLAKEFKISHIDRDRNNVRDLLAIMGRKYVC